MSRIVSLFLLTLALAFPQPATLGEDGVTSPELEQGIRQVREGDFSGAVVTLDDLVRRLGEKGGQTRLLARTYVYLSIAYLGLSQVEEAKAKFLEALDADASLDLSPSEFPPKYLEFFQDTRADAAAAQAAEAAAAAAAVEPPPAVEERADIGSTPPAAEGVPAEPPAVTETSAPPKKGSSKTLFIVGGVAAAGGLAAVAAGGGGGGGGSSSPSSPAASAPSATPTPVPALTPTFDYSISLNPPPGSTIRVPAEGWVDLHLELSYACDMRATGLRIRATLYANRREVGAYEFENQTCEAGQATHVAADRLLVEAVSYLPLEVDEMVVVARDVADVQLSPSRDARTILDPPYNFISE